MSRILHLTIDCPIPVRHLAKAEAVAIAVGKETAVRNRRVVVVDEFVRVRNTSDQKSSRFAVSKTDLDRVGDGIAEGRKIVGVIHSHGRNHKVMPSKADLEGIPVGMIGLVFKAPDEIAIYEHGKELAVYWWFGSTPTTWTAKLSGDDVKLRKLVVPRRLLA